MRRALDVLNEIVDRIGWGQFTTIETTPLDTEQRKALVLLNRVLRSLGGLDDWPQMRREGEIVLVASATSDLTVGTEQYVSVAQNSTTLTVANGTFDSTYLDRAIQVSGSQYVYRIDAVLSATQVTLNRAWVEASVVVGDERTFTAATDRYALPDDFDRPVGRIENFLSANGVTYIDPDTFMALRQREGFTLGDPQFCTIYGMNDAQTAQLIHFHPYPDDAQMLNYQYIFVHPEIDSDNDKILYPERHISIIVEMVIQLAYRDYEDDARMQVALADMVRNFNQQVSAKSTVNRPLVIRPANPARVQVRRQADVAGVRVNWGRHFDIVGNTGLD